MPPGKGRRNMEATPGPPDSVSVKKNMLPLHCCFQCKLLLVVLRVGAVLTLRSGTPDCVA